MGRRIQGLWLLSLIAAVGACGPTRTQVFVEVDERLGLDDEGLPDGGGAPPDPGPDQVDAGRDLTLDPDAVFDWEQTLPGGGECGPARYFGSYECEIALEPESLTIEGVINLPLIAGTSETGLLVSSGSISVADPLNTDPNTTVFWRTGLAGDLDCATGTLGAVSTPDQQLLGLSPVFGGPFDIRLDGMLDPDTLELSGDIEIRQQVGGQVCTGTWTTLRTP